MSTTIRITDEDKARLHRVQRRLTDLTGERMTLQRIVGLMAQHAQDQPAHILYADWDAKGAQKAVDQALKQARKHGGWEGSATEIDQVLYGY